MIFPTTFPNLRVYTSSVNTLIPNRLLCLGGVALLLFCILVSRWIAGWGLVTIHVKDAPLGKVISSMARQGHVRIETCLDASKPVSLDVDRVPVIEALEMLAIRADASWRLVYLAAPATPDLAEALISLRGSGKLEDWTTYYYPMPFGGGNLGGEAADPRYGPLSFEGPDQSLPQLLNQAAQKSGVMTAFPKNWAPTAPRLPKPGEVRKSIPALVQSVHGKKDEFFYLTDRDRKERPPGEAQPPTVQQEQPPQFPQPPVNPAWIEQRQLAQIAHLPPEKQADAKQEIQERKTFFAEMQKLPPEERQAKIQTLMSDPDRMEKLADRMLMRDSKMTAQQRISRAVNYISRKAAAQGR